MAPSTVTFNPVVPLKYNPKQLLIYIGGGLTALAVLYIFYKAVDWVFAWMGSKSGLEEPRMDIETQTINTRPMASFVSRAPIAAQHRAHKEPQQTFRFPNYAPHRPQTRPQQPYTNTLNNVHPLALCPGHATSIPTLPFRPSDIFIHSSKAADPTIVVANCPLVAPVPRFAKRNVLVDVEAALNAFDNSPLRTPPRKAVAGITTPLRGGMKANKENVPSSK
ncbi:hypothetical protein HGRIS_004712 [Hohenbuehelia grisea]|uniref:Uncharacterized protein n=1 Tax=Hohenbuehelia grisea TaxID=104357 RepID=A0ABR3JD52_9AGAR